MEPIEKASIGERFISYLSDSVPLGLLCFSLVYISPSIGNILSMIIPLAYFTYFFGNGQTPGMELMNIELCTIDGEHSIGYKRGFFRYIGMNLSALILGLGFLWILIDKDRQGWHDKIAKTYVVPVAVNNDE